MRMKVWSALKRKQRWHLFHRMHPFLTFYEQPGSHKKQPSCSCRVGEIIAVGINRGEQTPLTWGM